MESCPFRAGDLVIPSKLVMQQRWFSSCSHLRNVEMMVARVVRASTFDGWVVYFHDPCYGIRGWRSSYLTLVPVSLENE